MKILLVAHAFWPELNGVARVVTLLAESLIKRGCEVTVATQFSPKRKSLHWNGIEIVQFKISGNLVNGMRGEVTNFQEFIKNGNWDIQHHHACQIWGIDALLDWFPTKTRKVVVTPHGFSQLQNSSWENYFLNFKNISPFIDAFTYLSEAGPEGIFLNDLGHNNAHFIPNGIDLQEFNQNFRFNIRWNLGFENKFWMLNVSNHVGSKGHQVLYDLAKLLPDAVISNVGQPIAVEKWHLGKLGLKLPCYYKCKLQQAKITNFHSLELTRPELIDAYHQANIFVMPSEIEAAPLVILEAMAAGLPWVSYNVGNVKELAGGMVVKDKAELFEAVLYLQKNLKERQRLGKEGVEFVRRHFDWELIFDKYWKLYLEIDKTKK